MLKKLLAFAEVVLVVTLIVLILAIFTFYAAFSSEKSIPRVFGYSFFILDSSDMESETNGINKGALIVASADEIETLKKGMVVLCDIGESDGSDPVYDVLRIYDIEAGNERIVYTVSNEAMSPERTFAITKDRIYAKCLFSSDILGEIITFSRTTEGMLLLVILPCAVLIALQVVHIITRIRRGKYEEIELEQFEFPNNMEFPDNEDAARDNPLFEPENRENADKSIIEGNFANKLLPDEASMKRKKSTEKSDLEPKKKHLDKDGTEIEVSDIKVEEPAPRVFKRADTDSIKNEYNAVPSAPAAAKPAPAEKPQASAESAKPVPAEKPQASTESAKPVPAEKPQASAESAKPVPAEIPQASAESAKPVSAEKPQASAESAKPVSAEIPQASTESAKPVSAEIPQASAESAKPVSAEIPQASAESAKPVIAEKTDENSENAAAKKKTTVKKKAVAKKSGSASAVDLLKAIDSESKKLK